MVSINRAWWEHLAPKPMHRRFREVETLLRQWCRSEYGAYWLRIARQKHGVIRVKPGQFIPVVHFIALGDQLVAANSVAHHATSHIALWLNSGCLLGAQKRTGIRS